MRLISHSLKGVLGIPVEPWHPPSGEQVHELLTNNLQVDDDPKSPIVVVSIQSATPEVAQELLLNLAKAVDAILRQRALDRANDYIGYLTGQLGKVTVADYRAALVQHLSEQEQTRMMASANVSFAAQMFGDPSRSATPTAPKSLLLLILALAGSVLVGAIVANVVEHRQQGGEK